uniref:TF_AP-2 domain-containing protein n=2 Tax=Caenorhabditis tropicalis TaxID=1561998 RepID=A0A1I7TTB7_9PELO
MLLLFSPSDSFSSTFDSRMFNQKLMECSDDEFVRSSQCDDEEQQQQSSQRPPFYENMRTFAPSHMHISCHYDIPYTPHLIQPPCGVHVSTFTYARDFPGNGNSQQFFNQPPQPQPQQGNGGNGEDDYCIQKAEERDHHPANYSQVATKADRPFVFFASDCNSPLEIVGEVYCTVPGRTSLLSSTTKYRVTVAEIQRRISPPECLNASLLGGILRKAKSKDGGKTLRDSLKKLGLTLPAGRRKQANVTAWTALVEEEAIHMAKDFALVCEKEFHSREIGIYLTKTSLAIDPDVVKRRAALEMSRKMIGELAELLSCDRTPLTPYFPRNMLPIDPSVQQHLSHFTLMTHGFGNVAMSAVLESVKLMIDESIKYIDRCCSQNVWR